MKRIILVLLILITIMSVISACSSPRYTVYYLGETSSHRVGKEVTLYFDLIATDTDYSFYVDGERINPLYDEKKGYIIEFTMPDHDVHVDIESVNSMVYVGE